MALAQEGFDVSYTDINTILIDFARWRFQRRGLKIPIIDPSRLQERPFDCLVSFDVFEHFKDLPGKIGELSRCVRAGGVVAMIEPWVTPWSRQIYTRLHHEPFRPEVKEWEFPSTGPLSGANGALPWIIFERDRVQFEREFPMWQIRTINPIMPFRYLVSGGVSLRSLMPGYTFRFWRGLENLLHPWMGRLAMFAQIVLQRTD
jgi:hypothetical protein